jgi:CheY-like chemotaxis protein
MATILCIDNDPRILELHRALFAGSGYTVLTALDGLTGIALTRTHSMMLSCSISRSQAWTEMRSPRY